jgi:Cdc6-like AAA superfamily ATPase
LKTQGTFPENINPSDLNTIKSEPKNKEIARIFFLHKIIEDRGSGIARVQDLLQKRNMRPAEFKQENGFVTVTVYKHKFRTFHNTSENPLLYKVIGRENDLIKIHEILQIKEQSIVINGVKEVGKTTLARYYIQRYSTEYQHIIWLYGKIDVYETFFSDILLLDNLGIKEQVFEYLNKENRIAALQLIIQTLNKLSAPVLLVIDDAQNLETFQSLIPFLDKSVYHVLITSDEKEGDFLFYSLTAF